MVIMHTCLLSRILATVMDNTVHWYSSAQCKSQPREGSPHNVLHSPSIILQDNWNPLIVQELFSELSIACNHSYRWGNSTGCNTNNGSIIMPPPPHITSLPSMMSYARMGQSQLLTDDLLIILCHRSILSWKVLVQH